MKFSNQAYGLLIFGLAMCAGSAVSLMSAPVHTSQVVALLPGAPPISANKAVMASPAVFKPTGALHVSEMASVERDLEADINAFMDVVEDPSFDGARCQSLLSSTYRRLLAATPTDFAVGVAARNNYISHGSQYVQDLFNSRIELRHRLGALAASGKLTTGCLSSARDLFRASRVLEDLLGEIVLGHPKFDEAKKAPVLRGNAPWLLVNPNLSKLALRSGDVILSRGTAFSSAAIARIGEGDTNFSHLAIVYIDPLTHKMFVSEAHIEIGSFNRTFGEYLIDGKVRAAVFRHKDPILAHRAATLIREKLSEYQAAHAGENYPYDFSMNADDHTSLFCSELVSYAFELARDAAVAPPAAASSGSVPMFRSKVNPRNRDFLDHLGVKVRETFLPGDIEFDPNFELIAEWRDYSRMNENHLHDAVTGAIFEWMDRDGYVFQETLGVTVKKKVAWNLRRWPLFSALLKDKLPKNMSQSTIATVSTLDIVGEILFTHLEEANNAAFHKTGDWLTPAQMSAVLETYRQSKPAELALYFRRKGS